MSDSSTMLTSSSSTTTTTTKLPLSSSPDLINEQQYCSCRCNPNENEKNHPNHHHYNGCLYCHKNYTKEEEEDKDKVLMCQFCSTINTTTSLPSSSSSSTKSKSKSKLYQPITKCQLRQHTNIKSGGIWILCNSKIYDVTTYIQYHPGGINSILNKSGGIIDCSYDFSFHSHKAKKLWNSMMIGYLVPCGGDGGDGGGHNHYHRGQQSNYFNHVKRCMNSRSGNSSDRSSDSYYDSYDGRLRDEGKTRDHDNDHAIFHNSINSTLIETTTTTNQCVIS